MTQSKQITLYTYGCPSLILILESPCIPYLERPSLSPMHHNITFQELKLHKYLFQIMNAFLIPQVSVQFTRS